MSDQPRSLKDLLSPELTAGVLEGEVTPEPALRKDDVCILVAGLRGYAEWCESRDPMGVGTALCALYAPLLECLARRGGTLDRFLAGGLIGLFGAPIHETGEHDQALHCALEMVAAADRVGPENSLPPLAIAIATGPVAVGFIGGGPALCYTAVGDVVNVALSLQRYACCTDARVVASEAFVRAASKPDEAGMLAAVQLDDRKEPVQAFRLA